MNRYIGKMVNIMVFRIMTCLAGAMLLPDSARSLMVDTVAMPFGGGQFHHEFSVTDEETADVAVVGITDAPTLNPYIGPSITATNGFLASYDAVLDVVDFVENTMSFAVGTTIAGFGFDSESSPVSYFQNVEALTINGDFIAGQLNAEFLPEPSSWLSMATGFLMLILAVAGGRGAWSRNGAFPPLSFLLRPVHFFSCRRPRFGPRATATRR